MSVSTRPTGGRTMFVTVAPCKCDAARVPSAARVTVNVVPETPVTNMISESTRTGNGVVVGNLDVEMTWRELVF